MRTRRIAALGLLTLTALVLAALAVAVLAGSGSGTPQQTTVAAPLHPVAGNFKPDATDARGLLGRRAAVPRAGLREHRLSLGPEARRSRFSRSEIEFATNACHRIAHNIGSASLARYDGNVGRTFAEGFSDCASGYYHGVLERSS